MEFRLNESGNVKTGKYEGSKCVIEYNKDADVYFVSFYKDNERAEEAFVSEEDLKDYLKNFEIEWFSFKNLSEVTEELIEEAYLKEYDIQNISQLKENNRLHYDLTKKLFKHFPKYIPYHIFDENIEELANFGYVFEYFYYFLAKKHEQNKVEGLKWINELENVFKNGDKSLKDQLKYNLEQNFGYPNTEFVNNLGEQTLKILKEVLGIKTEECFNAYLDACNEYEILSNEEKQLATEFVNTIKKIEKFRGNLEEQIKEYLISHNNNDTIIDDNKKLKLMLDNAQKDFNEKHQKLIKKFELAKDKFLSLSQKITV